MLALRSDVFIINYFVYVAVLTGVVRLSYPIMLTTIRQDTPTNYLHMTKIGITSELLVLLDTFMSERVLELAH